MSFIKLYILFLFRITFIGKMALYDRAENEIRDKRNVRNTGNFLFRKIRM
jgi:hypothetical protein